MIRGNILMRGCFGKDDEAGSTLEPDARLRTSDLARMDAGGNVSIVDRKKDIIVGHHVDPAESERIIAGHYTVAFLAVG